MRKRIFRTMYLFALLGVLITGVIGSLFLYHEVRERMELSVRNQGENIAHFLNQGDSSLLQGLPTVAEQERITLIASDGTVLFDNQESLERLENHKERPEIVAARETGRGELLRSSKTMGQTSYYYAVLLDNGMVLRVGNTTKSALRTIADSLLWTALLLVVLVIFSRWLSRRLTEKLVEPIYAIEFDNPRSAFTYEELSPLLLKIESQNQKIAQQMQELNQHQQESNLYLEAMQEGLILLDENRRVITANGSAVEILQAPPADYTGKPILHITRNAELLRNLNMALTGRYIDTILPLSGRKIQLHTGPLQQEGQVVGVLLLLLDVTEKEEASQLRREFSANVSHELKTPLTSISGYAEIMRDGLVQPVDVPEFAGRIYNEAQTLVALINDIMRISQLDENTASLPMEEVSLWQTAETVLERLEPLAQEKQIELRLEGESVTVEGVPQLLSEILYNLCENSIKYSEAGEITVRLAQVGQTAVLTVEDKGIGIGAKDKHRVFERFYRVDQSHSKVTGGTGLGLSIVKNGVKYHGGQVSLASELGEGTTVTIVLPRKQT